eukprot:GGOE01017977.1.p1 GENE.GGOE01017977.1~~GGOE01017977.1.p1  ORF type:complete len:524 (+),score=97.42 GGOE01017977.1:72-1574(+)
MPAPNDWGALCSFIALLCREPPPPPGSLSAASTEEVADRLQTTVRHAIKAGRGSLDVLVGSKRLNHQRQAAGQPPIRPKVILSRLLWVLTDVDPLLRPKGEEPREAAQADLDRDALAQFPVMQRLEALLTSNWHLADKDKILEERQSCLSLADLVCWWCLQCHLHRLDEAQRQRFSEALPFTASWFTRVSQSQLLPPEVPRVLLRATGRDPGTHHLESRGAALHGVLDEVEALTCLHAPPGLRHWAAVLPEPIDWTAIPADLDPFSGQVSAAKAMRKRLQIENFATLVGAFLASTPCSTVVEFGAGGGHLGLVLAAIFPSATFVLLELDPKAHAIAVARVQRLGLSNVQPICTDAAAFTEPFNLLVGLHCCGSLTDAALAHCLSRRAAFILCPCCYGHAADPLPTPGATPLGAKLADHWQQLRAAADFSSMASRDEEGVVRYDLAHPRYLTAVRCMRAINVSRALRLADTHVCTGHVFSPATSTPKNLCIVGIPIPPPDG